MNINFCSFLIYCVLETDIRNIKFCSRLEIVEKAENSVTIKSGDNKVVLMGAPFRIDLYSGNSLVVSGNARGLLRFEHQQIKQEP